MNSEDVHVQIKKITRKMLVVAKQNTESYKVFGDELLRVRGICCHFMFMDVRYYQFKHKQGVFNVRDFEEVKSNE